MASLNASIKQESMEITSNTPLPEFVNFDQKLKCTACKKLLLSPMQLPCGHRICKECKELLTSSKESELQCPSREEDCGKFGPADIFPDYSALREIRQLSVFCSYKAYGCSDTMPWSKLKSHVDQCKFRNKTCTYCNTELPVELYQNHIDNDCEQILLPCPYNCGDVGQLRRLQLESHKQNCRLKPKDCKYKNMGCKFQGTVEKIAEHESDYKFHLEMTIDHSLTLSQEINKLKASLDTANANVRSLQTTVSTLTCEKDEIYAKFFALEKEFRKTREHQKDLITQQSSRVESASKEVEKITQDFQLIRIKQNQQDTKMAELEKQRRPSVSLPEEMRQQFISHDRTIGLHDMRLSELDLRIQCLQTANYEGVLIWKIADYHKRKQEAIGGNIMSLYSQPFYTSRYGYKMCGRVYLNGDGIGKGTHLSFFFVVMQGDYDDIIPWPFRQKVTLTLLDQKNNRRHLSDTFRPDPNSNSFQKPQTPMNVASGCPLFVPHTVLEDREEVYLRNNTIYIKITVDTSDLLNP